MDSPRFVGLDVCNEKVSLMSCVSNDVFGFLKGRSDRKEFLK
jgi:hypothetical protein